MSTKLNPRELHMSYKERVESKLKSQGVIFFDSGFNLNISKDYLALPAEITEVPSKDLGEYLNAFTQQKVYMRTLVGRLELMLEEVRREYNDVSDPYYKNYSTNTTKYSETAKERLVNMESTVKKAYRKLSDVELQLSIVRSSIANIEDIIFMLSREVTRRTGDFIDENRLYNVQNKKRG